MFDPVFIGILLIPMVISLVLKLAAKWDISWAEYGIQFVIGLVCLGIIWGVGNGVSSSDREVLNGQVVGKHEWKFYCPTNTSNPCRNGYSCNFRQVCTGTGKDRSCRTEHDTCYTYPWEKNWYVDTNLPNAKSIEIDRVDRQGREEPQRYSIARVGDPASSTHGYKNWVKASANTLFKDDGASMETHKALLGDYPLEIIDYYRIDRIITPNYRLANERVWNDQLSYILRSLGPSKQMNIVVVVVNNVGRDYAFGLRRHWQGFKKNDAVIVIGLRSGTIEWAETMSWSKDSIFNIDMRNMIEDRRGTPIEEIDPAEFMNKVQTIAMKDFVRRPMKEFEYLKGDIPPPGWLIILSIVFAVGLGVGTSVLFHRIDITDLGSNSYRRRF